MFLLYKKIEINCMTLYIPFDYFSLQDSKWHLQSIQII
jgi:hypothetical protein